MQYRAVLDALEKDSLLRMVRTGERIDATHIRYGDTVYCDFSSNDYLGLSSHPAVVAAASQALQQHGLGGTASRLISGTLTEHTALEKRIAQFKNTEAAIVFSTGYMTNVGVITALLRDTDVVMIDKLSHASIIDACRMTGAELRTFPHRNYERLEKMLERRAHYTQCLIITDSVFSMDGDQADLTRLVAIKKKYNALLMIDEAHATGVFGDGGRGLAAACGVERDIDIMMGTLSKALGSLGGFVAGSQDLIDFLYNKARSFIYTTALPPAVCAGALAAIDFIEKDDTRRQQLWRQVTALCTALQACGVPSACPSPIIPIILGDADRAVRVSETLFQKGMYVPAVRYPTVPKKQARLRVSLSAMHTDEDIEALCTAIKAVV